MPSHEIMALFVLRKLILQTRMRSHPMGRDVLCLVGPFVYFYTSCIRAAKALARLRGCAGADRLCDKYHNLMSWLLWWCYYTTFWISLSSAALRKIKTSPFLVSLSLSEISSPCMNILRSALRFRTMLTDHHACQLQSDSSHVSCVLNFQELISWAWILRKGSALTDTEESLSFFFLSILLHPFPRIMSTIHNGFAGWKPTTRHLNYCYSRVL